MYYIYLIYVNDKIADGGNLYRSIVVLSAISVHEDTNAAEENS